MVNSVVRLKVQLRTRLCGFMSEGMLVMAATIE